MRLSLFLLASILLARPAAPAQIPTGAAPPTGWHVTVPAEGGLIFQMKVNGQGPYRTVFDTGAVNVMSASFANNNWASPSMRNQSTSAPSVEE